VAQGVSGLDRLLDLEPDAIRCPFPAYRELRQSGHPVWNERLKSWVVSRYDDILQVLRDPITFSSAQASGPGSITSVARTVVTSADFPEATHRQAVRRLKLSESPVLVTCDPPAHKRQRALLGPGFTPRRVAAMEPQMQQIADALVDDFVGTGRADLVGDFALPLPLTVIARLLGIPMSLMHMFKRWSDAFTQQGLLNAPAEEVVERFQSVDEFYDYFAAEMERRRANPGDDLMTDLIAARWDGDERLTDDEMLQILSQLLVAGNETTTNLISSAMYRLLRDPDLMGSLRTNADRIPAFVEECLRLEAPTQGMFRIATADSVVGDQQIRAGEMIYLVYASGNRDVAAFPNPDVMVLDESHSHHLAFGRGEHVCLGAHVARREALIAIRTLLSRLEDLALAEDDFEPAYRRSFVLRSVDELPVTFRSAG
jgi:cytochrome P450